MTSLKKKNIYKQFSSPRRHITSLHQLERLLTGQRRERTIMCHCPLLCQKGMTLCETSTTLPAFKMATIQTLRYLIEEPHTKDDLYEVVDNEHSPKIHRFPILHDPGAEHFNEVGVAETNRQRWERTAHQHPVIHTWICKQSQVSGSQFMRNGWPVHASRVAGSQSVRLGIHTTVTNTMADSSEN
jgi:hypothetical protein